MPNELKKAGGIVFLGFCALKITEAFEIELIPKLNEASQYASFLNPNLVLNLIGYSFGDLLLDMFKAGILVASAFGIYKIFE